MGPLVKGLRERTPEVQTPGSLWLTGRVETAGMTQAETNLQECVPESMLTPGVC